MADITPQDFAASNRGLVVAPAGCGKTHLISEATKYCSTKQLILTHTHAGVKAIRDRMARLEIQAHKYKVCTLDSFALRYAAAFPGMSGWTIRKPEREQWAELRPAANKVLQANAIEAVLRASYGGVFVDEYQDCTIDQHAMVKTLSEILPCRVLGDPLQAIFNQINQGRALSWLEVTKDFPLIGELTNPYRWLEKNKGLGEWLFCLRQDLLSGNSIDLRSAPGITIRDCTPNLRFQLAECKRALATEDASIVGLVKWRTHCHKLSGSLNNRYSPFEDAQCEDLLNWAHKIENAKGSSRAEALVDFARKWLTNLPPAIDSILASVKTGKSYRTKKQDLISLKTAFEGVSSDESGLKIVAVLDAYKALEKKPTCKSHEVFLGLRKAALNSAISNKPLSQAAWDHRDNLRRIGRQPYRRCLSTPLLVKGLEFDYVMLLDTSLFSRAEDLYVSLTRATTRMTILTPTPILKAPTRIC